MSKLNCAANVSWICNYISLPEITEITPGSFIRIFILWWKYTTRQEHRVPTINSFQHKNKCTKKKPLSIFKLEHFQTQQLLSLCLKLQKLSTDLNLKTHCSSLQKSSVLPGPFICLSSCTSACEPLTDRALSALLSKPTYPRC